MLIVHTLSLFMLDLSATILTVRQQSFTRSTFSLLLLLLLFTRPLPRDGDMAEDHGAPEARQIPRAWTRGHREIHSACCWPSAPGVIFHILSSLSKPPVLLKNPSSCCHGTTVDDFFKQLEFFSWSFSEPNKKLR